MNCLEYSIRFIINYKEHRMIEKIANGKAFKKLLDNNHKVFAAFTASWCGPCNKVKPYVEKLAKDNPEIRFANIDIDEAGDLVSSYKIKTTPTFITFKDEREVDKLASSDQEEIKQLFEDLTKL